MRAFACPNCSQLVFFENTACLNCGTELGFRRPERELGALAAPRCANFETAACNWVVERPGELCFSCRLTRTRPADDDDAGLARLRRAEAAKRRLLFELGELNLPIPQRTGQENGLVFDLLSSEQQPVTTGHAEGVVTLDLAEADDPHRERVRQELGEPYRTLLGHFRHEVGHFYWTVLAPDEERRARGRMLFGDERDDYAAALDRHYAQGPPDGWQDRHVSAYASMHPAEDWAETFAHLLHMRDGLQTAAAYGVGVRGPLLPAGPLLAAAPRDEPADFEEIIADWLALTYALNAINRSMGRDDLYPFILAPAVVEKLRFVHDLIGEAAVRRQPSPVA
jgi:hypothetical protein